MFPHWECGWAGDSRPVRVNYLFLNEWQSCKREFHLPKSATAELWSCCWYEVRMELVSWVVHWSSERTVSAFIYKIPGCFLKSEIYAMQQEPSQSVQHFVTGLQAKVEHCHFLVRCNSTLRSHKVNNYSSELVTAQLMVGLADKDI